MPSPRDKTVTTSAVSLNPSVTSPEKLDQAKHLYPAKRAFLLTFWLLIGPGLLAMVGDNDAGGVISYAVTGATFGMGWFIPIILLLMPVTYTIQEMTMRLGMVSQRPFPLLVFERFGRFWGYFSLFTLLLENLLTLVTEFIGMSVGLSTLGVPFTLATIGSLLCVVSFALFGRYFTKERLALLVGFLNIVFIVIAFTTKPDPSVFLHALVSSPFAHSQVSQWLFFLIATVGNAVAPWMIFFQGSAVIDKGMTHHDLRFGRLDTALGSFVQAAIAIGIVVTGAALYQYAHIHPAVLTNPTAMLQAYLVKNGVFVRDLFALGLVNAGFLAAMTISLSTSWTFAGVFSWAKSLNDTVKEAPKFYAMYIGGLVVSALVVLIPGLPLTNLAVASQALAGILIVPLLIFLVKLTSDKKLMRVYVNGKMATIRVWTVTIVIIVLSAWLIMHTIFSL